MKESQAIPQEKVIILDFGAQYSQLIARRVRECRVYSEIMPGDSSVEEISARNPGALILTGGPGSVYHEDALTADEGIFELGIPVLGICYGHQLIAAHYGGREAVGPASRREYGRTSLQLASTDRLFAGIPSRIDVWMSHGDLVNEPPDRFKVLAHSEGTPVAAMVHEALPIYGVQFHPEVGHTDRGLDMLRNWLHDIAGFSGEWDMKSFIEHAVQQIREQVGSGSALCGLSGGVDSAVSAVLVHRAIGDRLTCVFVDHGLLRKEEAHTVTEFFAREMELNVVAVDASERFLSALAGVSDPEQKRKIVGHEFISVFDEQARALGDFDFLVQGTIYPDVVESGVGGSAVIKSHHNVGGLPEKMRMALVEPLRELFKDEVRRVGEALGIPGEILTRHPFPGPGLAVRVLGEITREKLDTLREADAIFEEELRAADLYRDIWQSFVVLPDMLSVGVMGDQRTYASTAVLRAVTSEDAMTADWARIPADVLDVTARRIINEVPGINRVAYDITSKPPATIEWE